MAEYKEHEASPNAAWKRLNCTIVRDGRIRTILDSDGNVILHKAGFEAEVEYCKKHLPLNDPINLPENN